MRGDGVFGFVKNILDYVYTSTFSYFIVTYSLMYGCICFF